MEVMSALETFKSCACTGLSSARLGLAWVGFVAESVPLGKSLLGKRDLRDVDALDLARLETLVDAWPRGAALLALADLTEITSTSLSGALTMKVGSRGGACPCDT